MAENPVNALKSLPPKRIAVVVVVGIGGGLLWRHFKGRGGSGSGGGAASTTQAATDPTDLSQFALAGSSTGASAGGTTSGIVDPNVSTRDTGGSSLTLPTIGWVVTIGGKKFWTNGVTLEPLDGTTPNPGVTPTLTSSTPPTPSTPTSIANGPIVSYIGATGLTYTGILIGPNPYQNSNTHYKNMYQNPITGKKYIGNPA